MPAADVVSHHLGVLRELGLVTACRDEQDARLIYYAVNRSALAQLNTMYLCFSAADRAAPWRLGCCVEGDCCRECLQPLWPEAVEGEEGCCVEGDCCWECLVTGSC